MDYRPRYAQPFTLEQAVHLDVPIISEEIARLQNSLSLLRSTQEQLKEANEADPDPEFVKAIEENDEVIGSQEERVSILRMALAAKGIPMSDTHYSLDPPTTCNTRTVERTAATTTEPQRAFEPEQPASSPNATSQHFQTEDDGGIDL